MRIHALAPLLAAASLIGCSTPRIDLTPRLIAFDIEGDIGLQEGGSVTAKADLNDAGLQKDDSVFGGRADLDFGPMHLMVSTQQSSHGGDGTLDTTISYGGTTISAGADVASDLDLGLHTAALTWDLFPTDLVEVGLGLGVTYVDLQMAFEESLTGERIDEEAALPVPLLAARLGARFWRVDASLQASGLTYQSGGDEISLFDLDLMAKLRLLGDGDHLAGHLTAGYRWVDLAVDYEDDGDRVEGDLTFSGPYIGLTVSI